MSTYSIRCRNSACRHRRVTRVHPDEYIRVPRCAVCGKTSGWRIEDRAYNRRGLCRCDGPTMAGGKHFPHRTTHPLCDNNPDGERNQALRRGVPVDDLPLELMGEHCGTDEAPF